MNEKILVVDDEKEIADLVEYYLTNEGFEVKNSMMQMRHGNFLRITRWIWLFSM